MPIATPETPVLAAQDSPIDTRLPVTLLSGFLGSGKTTLLSYILKSKDHGLRCAVIVNDMGALNIDASLISNHKLTQKEEKLIQMQNGCICCTLRADLLEEVANLAEAGSFDYLIIESSGISEPIQVAETFTQEFAESIDNEDEIAEIEASIPSDPSDPKSTPESRKRLARLIAQGGLSKIARLDTCVSMVDCTTFLSDFDTTDFLTDRHGAEVTPEDERNITDLLTDQIEFANVILLNKTDMVSKEQVGSIENLVRTLNPAAKILRTIYSKVDLKELLNTRSFDFEKAATGAGWLQSLKESSKVPFTDADGVTRMIPKPETLEYGIGSFVYQARRPFHPRRLWDLVSAPFAILQTTFEDDDEDDDSDADAEMEVTGDAESETEDVEMYDEEKAKAETLRQLQADKAALDLPARAKVKRESPIWKGLLRSKGFIWLASRPDVHGEWSQAGIMFTMAGGSRWFCTTPEEDWPLAEMEGAKEAIKQDFYGKWGDRRQELVFIGQELDKDLITKTLNEVLLTDSEWAQWEKIMNSKRKTEKKHQKLFETFEDGWEDWLDPQGEDEHDEDPSAKQEHTAKHKHAHDHLHHDHSIANKRRKTAAIEVLSAAAIAA